MILSEFLDNYVVIIVTGAGVCNFTPDHEKIYLWHFVVTLSISVDNLSKQYVPTMSGLISIQDI